MSLAIKAVLLTLLAFHIGAASARDVHILVVGDQSSANCHAHRYGPVPGVFVLGVDGQERQAADPLPWADCEGGSIWIPLAARLIKQTGVNKVVLLPVAISGVKAKDWKEGPAATRLSAALALAKAKKIGFDYALWQQGRSDADTAASEYSEFMRKTIRATSLIVKVDKWLVAESGTCPDKTAKIINISQKRMGQQFLLNRLPGASDAGLSSMEQLSDCSFSMQGQERMAQRWIDAMRSADALSRMYKRETLIEFFK